VVGSGPLDLVCVPEWWNHVEDQWEEPHLARFLERLASFSRLIVFDKRGTGLSDPVPLNHLPTLESWMEDLTVVLDAAGSTSAAIGAESTGGHMAMLFAATYPMRTRALVLVNSYACMTRHDDYPAGLPPAARNNVIKAASANWGTPSRPDARFRTPSMANDAAYQEWVAHHQRQSASPGTVAAMIPMLTDVDVRPVLDSIQVPTLVLHRAANEFIRPAHGRYLAEHIPGAKYVEVPGVDQAPELGDADTVLAEIQEFLTGIREAPSPDRVLATVLFTDIVASTERVTSLGDHQWRELLDAHDRVMDRQLERFRGRKVDSAGDGVLATFDGPARAIRCACAIRDAVRALGLDARVGLHTGEIEQRGDDIAGIVVHIGQRVSQAAQPGEVLVSRTVVDLVAGSGIDFEDRGEHELKGVPTPWQLFRVIG
jgi:class 3 adenylate cyclase